MRLVGEIAEQVRGVTYSKDEAREDFSDGLAPIIRANNINDDGLSFEDLVYVPEARIAARQRLKPGDVVVAASSGSLSVVGKAAPLITEFNGSFGAFCKVLRPNTKVVNSSYFANFFKTSNYRHTISNLASGANINNLKNEHLDNLEIPIPPLDEQRRIAAILDKADALRRKRKRALKLLDGLTQAAFTEKFGTIDDLLDRDDLSSFGDLVEDGRIGLVRSADELSSSPGGTPYVRMDAISLDGRLSLSPIRYTKTSAAEQAIYELKDGDFLFNTRNSRELVGKTAVYDGPPGYVYNNNILRIRFKRNVNAQYVQSFFRTQAAKRELEIRKAGTTSVFAIYQKNLYEMRVVVPQIADQQEFAAQIQKVVEHRKYHEQHLLTADLMFAVLQHRAFSGQL